MNDARPPREIRAVIFDLDGVLIDSEHLWEKVRRAYVLAAGGTYHDAVTTDVMGMSAPEWSHYIVSRLGVARPARQISDDIVRELTSVYRATPPTYPGAVEAVRRIAARVPVAVASSSNRSLIDLFVEISGLGDTFATTVSSEEVGRGKPSPDVYLRAAEKLGIDPRACGAVEDSSNGIRAAHAAGCYVIALPNPEFPPAEDALALAGRRIRAIADLTPEMFGL